MHSTSYIELSQDAYKHNLKFLQSMFDDSVCISSVVKGNAYGHGIKEFVPMVESCGVSHFSVHSADEARKVLDSRRNKNTEIMIMGYINNEDLEWAIANDVSFFVFEFDRLIKASEVASRQNKKARVHVEVETLIGLNWKCS